MFAKVANYANDAAAVEKSLRLLQAFVQIAAGTAASPADAKTWSTARGHFALARRYLRLFKWIDCSQIASQTWKSETESVRRVLGTAKFGLLALYFFMEMFCISNAMNMTSSPILYSLQHHALQTWFIAISVSLLLSTYDYLNLHIHAVSPTLSTTTSSSSFPTNKQLYTTTLLDLCDILIPGSAVGWMPASSVTVGVTSSISSIIAGTQIWGRVQKEAREKEIRKRVARKVRFEGVDEKAEKVELKDLGKSEIVKENVKSTVVDSSNIQSGTANGSTKKRSKRA